jgi:hypothetical protein
MGMGIIFEVFQPAGRVNRSHHNSVEDMSYNTQYLRKNKLKELKGYKLLKRRVVHILY